MEKRVDEAVEELLAQFSNKDEQLVNEVRAKLSASNLVPVVEEAVDRLSFSEEARERVVRTVSEEAGAIPEAEARLIAETIVRPTLRPVLKIRDNTLLMEFFNADSIVWRERLIAVKSVLDAVIPAVGRIELSNHPGFDWVGTGWLIADDIVVTNRHVAREFARRDGQKFVFRQGLNGLMNCRVDFLEEFERSRSLEFSIAEILWVAPVSDADIAFLRVNRNSNGTALSRPVKLAANKPTVDQFVATIGYPARDDEFPDQDLARRVFGDVYDKKRLAPGQIIESPDNEVLHDCSTLGGNSGSVVIDLQTGEAVALHYAGLFPTANYAVPAEIVRDRLRRVLRGEFAPVLSGGPVSNNSDKPKETTTTTPVQQNQTPQISGQSATFIIPLQITIGFGTPTLQGSNAAINIAVDSGGPQQPSTVSNVGTIESALKAARIALAANPNVASVNLGYRFKDNWITDERVIVVEVKDKSDSSTETIRQIPGDFNGFGVEVRSIGLLEKLRSEGVAFSLIEERVARGRYRKPTNLRLREVRDEPMTAIFHASPDSGFPNLRRFLSRTQNRITATMYEFEAEHISEAIKDAIRPAGRRLKMVTQKNGEMVTSIRELKDALGNRFDHVWASVGNATSNDTNLLFPKAYHIKVAVRDGEEFWLSSGNWKSSGQPDIDPAGNDSTAWTPLRSKNREWHAVIKNESLAKQFEDYINYDFSEAHRVPLPEAVEMELPDIFVPEYTSNDIQTEAPAHYFDPLVIPRPLRIQPLLSPDNYIEYLTGMIEEAERTIYVQNQSFNLLAFEEDDGAGNNERAFYDLFALLKDRQATHEVKIIFRDSREFGNEAWESQKKLLSRLKDFGFDTNRNVKLQKGCHTKGVIVDSEKVLIGSHNLTNQGALFNRDASLLVYDAEVARYYQAIFLFDWENLARQQTVVNESVGGAIFARRDEATPQEMRRVSLAELLYDFIE